MKQPISLSKDFIKSLTITILLAISSNTQAQSILNGNFEDWTIYSYVDPDAWVTSNDQFPGSNRVSQVTGFNGKALKLETKSDPDLPQWHAGVSIKYKDYMPFTQKPTAIIGKVITDLKGADSAVITVQFKKNGTIISTDDFYFTGKNGATFQNFSFPINLSTEPDSVMISCGIGTFFSQTNAVNTGSSIILDDISFAGPDVTQALVNGDFEQWTPVVAHRAKDWESSLKIFRSEDKYKGSYALKMLSNSGGGGSLNNIIGTRPFGRQFDLLKGWYKLITKDANARFKINITYSETTGPSGQKNSEFFELRPTLGTAYNGFEFNLASNWPADYITIFLTVESSQAFEFFIDELQLQSQPITGLNDTKQLAQITSMAYPNPVKDKLLIEADKNGDMDLVVYDVTGRIVLTNSFVKEQQIEIKVGELSAGVYHYQLQFANGGITQGKFVKE